MLNDIYIKTVLTSVKNPQANAPAEQVHQVVLNMIVTNDLDKKVFDYIDPWDENLVSIEWSRRASYYRTMMATPVQDVFGRDMLFNLTSVIYWRVTTAAKKHQADIDNVIENARQFTHDYAIGNQVYVEINGIYRKICYKKKVTYIITEVLTNIAV